MTEADKRERTLGWAMAVLVGLHFLILRPQMAVAMAGFSVLLLGAVLRAGQVTVPRWVGHGALIFGLVAVTLMQGRFRVSSIGELALTAGAILLLRPITPVRGQWLLGLLLVMLVSDIISQYPTVGITMIIIDVASIFVLAEQIFRPLEMVVGFWVSVVRSLRLIVPVGLVVTGIFWLFPNMSMYTQPVLSGFTGKMINPGNISQIALSQRVALTASFPPGVDIPRASDLYWRGQILENNEGLQWSPLGKNMEREVTLSSEEPAPDAPGLLRYSQALFLGPGGFVPVLDHAVFVEGKRNDEDIAVLEVGAGVLRAVGQGPLTVNTISVLSPPSDAPHPNIALGATQVIDKTAARPEIQETVKRIFTGTPNTLEGQLAAISTFYREGGFRYTIRPGTLKNLSDFFRLRRGFCEHYAAASATMLRLHGTPARVVTGYRGGQWNPWLRTITVRDSDAHAWVEAWDAAAHQWVRYDPTDSVTPLAQQVENEMNSATWPWYRSSFSYVQSLISRATTWVQDSWATLMEWEGWENANTFLFGGFALAGVIWLIRNRLARRPSGPQEAAHRLLLELEHRAPRYDRDRLPGETPLSWLRRLENNTERPAEKATIHQLATAYESGMYKPAREDSDSLPELRASVRQLLQIWRGRAG